MDTLILMWKHPNTKKNYPIGLLSKLKNRYKFHYFKEDTKKAINDGFELLIGFPDIDQEYQSEKLFTVFERRIPPKSRKDFKHVVEKYNLNIYSDVLWQFLKVTNGRTGTDTFSLVEPIKIHNFKLDFEFNVAGWSFVDNINEVIRLINQDGTIYLQKEIENPKDPNAIAIYVKNNSGNEKVGYIPTPFNLPISKLLSKNIARCTLIKERFLDFDDDRPVLKLSCSLSKDMNFIELFSDNSPFIIEG